MVKRDIRVGMKVEFVDPLDYDRWFVSERRGIVIETRQYGPAESMVTVHFSDKRAHISDTQLRIVDDS